MKIADFRPNELREQLARGLTLALHPFVVRLQCPYRSVADAMTDMYGQREVLADDRFADFHIRVAPPWGLRRLVKPTAYFHFDGRPAFKPLPKAQAFPMLEWGLNWCIAAHAHQFLILHAAVVEMNGRAAVLPAPPGSGKSTLCAGLVAQGWRLLSDELALLDPQTMQLHALARPLNLKNQSIDVVRAFAPETVMTAAVPHTAKGTVALMAAPADSVARVHETARPAWVVFPRYQPGAEAGFAPRSKAWAAWVLAEQSFNYNLHGQAGFDTVTRMVNDCTCLDFEYSRLDTAIDAFAALAEGLLDDQAPAGGENSAGAA